jgi:hypothetical protein
VHISYGDVRQASWGAVLMSETRSERVTVLSSSADVNVRTNASGSATSWASERSWRHVPPRRVELREAMRETRSLPGMPGGQNGLEQREVDPGSALPPSSLQGWPGVDDDPLLQSSSRHPDFAVTCSSLGESALIGQMLSF